MRLSPGTRSLCGTRATSRSAPAAARALDPGSAPARGRRGSGFRLRRGSQAPELSSTSRAGAALSDGHSLEAEALAGIVKGAHDLADQVVERQAEVQGALQHHL